MVEYFCWGLAMILRLIGQWKVLNGLHFIICRSLSLFGLTILERRLGLWMGGCREGRVDYSPPPTPTPLLAPPNDYFDYYTKRPYTKHKLSVMLSVFKESYSYIQFYKLILTYILGFD